MNKNIKLCAKITLFKMKYVLMSRDLKQPYGNEAVTSNYGKNNKKLYTHNKIGSSFNT
jgi:ATP-dependent Zn protease